MWSTGSRLGYRTTTVVTFTGRDSEAARQEAIKQFQDGDARVIIGSIHAAGVGITLTAASTAVFCELDWTPGVMDQAADRIHRIGQRDSVMIYYCVLDGSLDHRMVATLVDKGYTVDAILG
jgi:SWI/SNF-related matrix-associated actin-dependent regulator 1 of chromatin subfamily A